MPAAASIAATAMNQVCRGIIADSLCGRRGEAEAVHHAVERPQVHSPVGDRQAAPVVPGRDLIPAGPQLFAGLAVEGVDRGMPRVRYATLRIRIEAAADPWTIWFVPGQVGKGLRGVFARPESEHDAVGDHDLSGHV